MHNFHHVATNAIEDLVGITQDEQNSYVGNAGSIPAVRLVF
jgi:hypothetical protein